jgi:predicted amidohydrolase
MDDERAPNLDRVTVLRTVRVAAIQATPVILDAEASVAKAVKLLGEAAEQGAEIAVLPETFVPLYPSNRWAHGAARFSGWDQLWEQLWTNAVEVPGPLVSTLVSACQRYGIHAVIGVNEREPERPGSLYNAMLVIGPEGVLLKHRKLMPTQHERLFHGIGAGDDLQVVDTPAGRVGGLICWENRMPWRPTDLGGTDRRRLGRLARDGAAHRDRVGRVRGVGPAVHTRLGLPGGLSGAGEARRRVRPRRRGHRRTDLG